MHKPNHSAGTPRAPSSAGTPRAPSSAGTPRAPSPPLRRRDATGHIDPTYARELLAKARENRNEDDGPDSARAFLDGSRSDDPLAEELGEAFVEAVTSGEESEAGRRDQVTEDEYGGPFVYTSGREEYALDMDESNIAEATREPLPRTSNAEP